MNGRNIGLLAGLATIGLFAGGMMWSEASAQDARGSVVKQRRVQTEPPHRCRNVLAEIQVMQSDLLDLDQRLEAKAELMSLTDQDERLDAMESVLREMVGQRRELRVKMKLTHQKIVSHILGHLMVEDPETRRDEMRACPLMSRMKASDEAFVGIEPW